MVFFGSKKKINSGFVDRQVKRGGGILRKDRKYCFDQYCGIFNCFNLKEGGEKACLYLKNVLCFLTCRLTT